MVKCLSLHKEEGMKGMTPEVCSEKACYVSNFWTEPVLVWCALPATYNVNPKEDDVVYTLNVDHCLSVDANGVGGYEGNVSQRFFSYPE